MEPWIVITRHPDYETDWETFGTHVNVAVLDYGSSFDGVPGDQEELDDWAESARIFTADAPDHVKAYIESAITELARESGLTRP